MYNAVMMVSQDLTNLSAPHLLEASSNHNCASHTSMLRWVNTAPQGVPHVELVPSVAKTLAYAYHACMGSSINKRLQQTHSQQLGSHAIVTVTVTPSGSSMTA